MAALAKFATVAVFLAILGGALLQEGAMATVYKVGDSTGWTTIGNYDYKQWAATKTFELGDVIIFNYNPQFHNVMQVAHDEFRACNTTAPIATHTTGNDSITITTRGHHFFLCGVPGHCQSGQKVDIHVYQHSLAPTPLIAPSPSTPGALAPPPSSAEPLYGMRGLFVKVAMCVALYATFVFGFA